MFDVFLQKEKGLIILSRIEIRVRLHRFCKIDADVALAQNANSVKIPRL